MRAKALFAGSAILLAALMVAIAAGQTPSPNSAPSLPQAQQAGYVLQIKTHVVTVDVVATDSHGNAVRDLKPEEFEVSDNGPQKITHFAFIDKSANSQTAKNAPQPRPNGFYANQAKFDSMAMPPTVVLMDSLNSDAVNLLQTRRDMILLLKTLPVNTPIAVFLLGQSLIPVQDFTSDPAVLRAAIDKAMKPGAPLDPLPENDADAPSLVAFDENGGQEDIVSKFFEEFEKWNYANVMDVRVNTTLDALRSIARYLSGYPGRKNLIWVSASFPITLEPDTDWGTKYDTFNGTRTYGEQVREASMALSNAQVAVYPVDARGLETNQVFDADQRTVIRSNSPSRTMLAQLNHEDDARTMSQGTMDQFAEGTGGKTCKNTNDLSGCIETALKDSSSYYELAYYPENAKWDGGFHGISVKTTRHGVKLAYRRGYFAQDAETLAKDQPPEKRLQQACQDFLPSTAIPITAQAVPSEKQDQIRYLMSVPPGVLSLSPDGQSHKLNTQMATCVYAGDGGAFRFTIRDLSRSLSDADFNTLQASGLRGYLDAPKSGTERVRIALLDSGTGLTGALDIAVHPDDFESAAVPPASPVPLLSEPMLSAPELPKSTSSDEAPENSPSLPSYSVTFHSSSGASSALDWNGETLSYHGDIGVAQTAPGYFHEMLGGAFQCEEGQLIPRDASDAKPNLHFSFANPAGHMAVVDLTGSEPQYSGDLPVDPSAKPFFERLWYLCHCRAAP
ncbi:MAG: VWA domain-containing protein [Candidatus Acidiferrales bacterium]